MKPCWTLIPFVVVSACVFDEPLKQDLGVVPEALEDGWEVASPDDVGISSQMLMQIHRTLLREDRFPGSLGLLVVKDGKLVWEAYFRTRTDRDHLQHVQSITKSVTSTVFGIARDQGNFDDLSQPLGEIFPKELAGLDSRKREITLFHLLTMSSGLEFDNIDFNLEMYTVERKNPLRYILSKPLYADPGSEFYYRNADPQLLSYAVKRVTGSTLEELADESLFQPLGIVDYYWQSGSDGVTVAGNGLHLRPRDLAKLGQLILDDGVWDTEPILSKEWMDEMTRAQTTSKDLDPKGDPIDYGYYWYVVPGGFSAWGNGGQYLLLQPESRLLLVHIARPDTSGLDGSTLGEFLELVSDLLCDSGSACRVKS